MYNATGTVTDIAGQRRVVQDGISTRVLEGLLGATLVLLVVSWGLLGETRVLTGSPSSIADRVALVGGGNLVERMDGQVWGNGKGSVE